VNTHKNARLTLPGRVLLIERIVVGGWSRRQVARAQGVSVKTVSKWLARWDQGGLAGLAERSSRPRRSPTRLAARLVRRIGRLRQRRRWTSVKIAQRLQLALATVVRWVRRLGLAVLPPVTPPPPRCRYERAQPGELVHVDTKRLARIVQVGHRITGDRRRRGPRGRTGWETLHVAVDDRTRLAYVELWPDERSPSAVGFLTRALAWFATYGIRVAAVMTDNAWAYVHGRYPAALAAHGIRHVRIRPYTPRTNGKAERFIQTALRDWAYARAYRTSAARAAALPVFLRYYNHERPHLALGNLTPAARLAQAGTTS
jgi:transposase InsO family protein